MSARTPMDILAAAQAKANAADKDRLNYQKTIAYFREFGSFNDEEITQYAADICVLMGKDDAAALALFPDGLYQTAEQARQGARDYWSKVAA